MPGSPQGTHVLTHCLRASVRQGAVFASNLSYILSESIPAEWSSYSVLELGSGTGIAGISVALASRAEDTSPDTRSPAARATHVVVSDRACAMPLLMCNVHRAAHISPVALCCLPW